MKIGNILPKIVDNYLSSSDFFYEDSFDMVRQAQATVVEPVETTIVKEVYSTSITKRGNDVVRNLFMRCGGLSDSC